MLSDFIEYLANGISVFQYSQTGVSEKNNGTSLLRWLKLHVLLTVTADTECQYVVNVIYILIGFSLITTAVPIRRNVFLSWWFQF